MARKKEDSIDNLLDVGIEKIADAQEVGERVIDKLEYQGAMIRDMYDELFEIDDELDRAKAITKRMVVRAGRSWCFRIQCSLIMGFTFFIIGWHIMGPREPS